MLFMEKNHFKYKNTYRSKVKRWRNIYHANTNQKKLEVAILIPDRVDIRAGKIIRCKDGYYIMIKGSII